MNEKELIEIQIANLQGQIKEKQKKLKELEKTKSPVEEAYKDWWGEYPGTGTETRWIGFQAGYEVAFAISTAKEVMEEVQEEPKDNEWKSVALRFGEKLVSVGPCGYYDFTPEEWLEWALNAYEKLADDWLKLLEKERIKSQNQVKKLQEKNWYDDVKTNLKPHWEPKPQNENEVAEGLRSAMRQAIDEGVIPPVEKPKTLTNLIERWWCDVFTTHSDWNMETSIDDLVDRIQLWIPKEQFANSQNEYVELTVEGFNDCVNKIKDNLR